MLPSLYLSTKTFRIKLSSRFLLLKHQKDNKNWQSLCVRAKNRNELDKNILFEHEIIWLFNMVFVSKKI